MRIIINTLLVLIVVVAVQKQASAQDNGDFLSGILGNQVETNQGVANGGQSNNNSNSDEFRLGIFNEDSDTGDSADAGDVGGGAGGGAGSGGGASET